MNWDKDIKNSLDAHLSGLHVSERQQAQMFNRIVQGEKPIMKRKISAALVFAIVLVLAMGTVALAAGLGLFGHFSNPEVQQRAPAGKAGIRGGYLRDDEDRRHADAGRACDGRDDV